MPTAYRRQSRVLNETMNATMNLHFGPGNGNFTHSVTGASGEVHNLISEAAQSLHSKHSF